MSDRNDNAPHSNLQVDLEHENGAAFVRLAGVVDEDSAITQVQPDASARAVVVNAADVARINSVGVRDWVNWIEPLSEDRPVYLVECSSAVVFHANFVTNFLGKSLVMSFYAPYYCTSCDHEAALLVDAQQMIADGERQAPSCNCDLCGSAMEFDDTDESYFSFLDALTGREVDASLAELVRKKSRIAGEVRAQTHIPEPPKTNTAISALSSGAFDPPQSLGSSGRFSVSGGDAQQSIRLAPPTPTGDVLRASGRGKGTKFRLEYLLVTLLVLTVVLVAVALFRQS